MILKNLYYGTEDNNIHYCRTTTKLNLPEKLCCGRLINVPVPGQVADRVFFLGGAGAVGTPTDLVYEWEERYGWTKFGNLPWMASYERLVALVYNIY